MDIKTQRLISAGLSILGIAGTVGTTFNGVNVTRKIFSETPEAKDISGKEFIKRYWKRYIPTLLLGTATIGASASSTLISKKTEASLIASAGAISAGWGKYQGKVKELLGIESHQRVIGAMAQDSLNEKEIKVESGRRLYFSEYTGEFTADPNKMAMAIADLRDMIIFLKGGDSECLPTIDFFLNECNAKIVDDANGFYQQYYTWGWNWDYLHEIFDSGQITIELQDKDKDGQPLMTADGNPYTLIVFNQEPIVNPKGGTPNE